MAERLPRCGAVRADSPDMTCIRPPHHPPSHVDIDGNSWEDAEQTVTRPLSYDVATGQLTCCECGQPVTGVHTPIVGRPRPRKASDTELFVDVRVDFERVTLQPCG